eukprot:2544851-Prymnesium_polylepis.1
MLSSCAALQPSAASRIASRAATRDEEAACSAAAWVRAASSSAVSFSAHATPACCRRAENARSAASDASAAATSRCSTWPTASSAWLPPSARASPASTACCRPTGSRITGSAAAGRRRRPRSGVTQSLLSLPLHAASPARATERLRLLMSSAATRAALRAPCRRCGPGGVPGTLPVLALARLCPWCCMACSTSLCASENAGGNV